MQATHDWRRQVRESSHPADAQVADEVIASSGFTFQLWRLYQHAWLVCLVFPMFLLVSQPQAPLRLTIGIAALLCFAAGYTWLMWPHPVSQGARARARSRASLILFVALGTLALVFSLVYGSAWLWLFIGVSAIAGVLLPMRSAFVVVVMLTLLPLLIILSMHGSVVGVDWPWIIALILLVRGLGLDMIGLSLMSSAIRELHTTREELARLKVEEERQRMARDLHDLLGHTLSLITLKSKLAGRLVEREPARAVQEIAEIEHIARQTLREVREAVAGYRQPRLENEVDGARQLLEAAGISCSLEYSALSLPPATDAALAWTVREGVTNVIRHSRAQHCFIRLIREHSTVHAEVINDGDPRERVGGAYAREGLGLSGLAERVTALGGRIEAGNVATDGKTGFRLWVELPIQNHGETTQEERA
jgi:two-component system, NarL family, sensor histidine kinase DesK